MDVEQWKPDEIQALLSLLAVGQAKAKAKEACQRPTESVWLSDDEVKEVLDELRELDEMEIAALPDADKDLRQILADFEIKEGENYED